MAYLNCANCWRYPDFCFFAGGCCALFCFFAGGCCALAFFEPLLFFFVAFRHLQQNHLELLGARFRDRHSKHHQSLQVSHITKLPRCPLHSTQPTGAMMSESEMGSSFSNHSSYG